MMSNVAFGLQATKMVEEMEFDQTMTLESDQAMAAAAKRSAMRPAISVDQESV